LRIATSKIGFVHVALLAFMVGAQSVSARPDGGDTREPPPAAVDWQSLVLRATGSGAPDVNALNPTQARFGAEKHARADALQLLMTQVRGVQINASKSVGDAMAASEDVRAKVESILRGYKVTAKRYYSDMGVELDVEIPLPPLSDLFATAPPPDPTQAPPKPKSTGVIVDARKLKVVPALEARLLDDSGQILYGVESLSAGSRKTAGVASYFHSIDQARQDPRVADRPLVIRAAKAQGSDIILGSDERKKLAESPSLLADGRVIILID
jgi:hypothetical protein